MQHTRGMPLEVSLDALNGRKSIHDALTKMPSWALFKRPTMVFITDAKEPRNQRNGNRQHRSSNCTGIRDIIRRPREQIRKTQTRTRSRLQKGKSIVKDEGLEYSQRHDCDGDGDGDLLEEALINAAAADLGSGRTRTSTSTGTSGTHAKTAKGHTRDATATASTTTLHALFFSFLNL
ncbi:hypothetical protein GGS26DRAFT_525156 [Hypomontagnella submonticulosa]|nr:hypothetical protein GGS26DRAFT_525156 [Hypomontagnella submonticulosa]